jgi:hypothetical protein
MMMMMMMMMMRCWKKNRISKLELIDRREHTGTPKSFGMEALP